MGIRNLLYISPQFPPNFIQFPLRLRALGINVFGIGSDYFGELDLELQRSLTEYYRVESVHDYEAILGAARYFHNKYQGIDRVESHVEFYLPVEARLRADLGIPGWTISETKQAQHKSLMKEQFRTAGIKVAKGGVISSAAQAKALAAEIGFPLVAKPDSGVGASATYRISSQDDLEHFLSIGHDSPYLMEELIEGELLTFDGLADRNGKMVYVNSLHYKTGIMDVVNLDLDLWYHTSREIDPRLEEVGQKVVSAFRIKEKFFHLEFFKPSDGSDYIGLEVNARLPGGLTIDMWNFADDIDLFMEWARIVNCGQFSAFWERRNFVGYVSRKDRYQYKHSDQEVFERGRGRIVHCQRMPQLFRPVMGDTAFLFRSPELSEVREFFNFVQER